MKTPRLNTEVYIKLNEPSQNKDKAAQTRQKDTAKAVIPVLQAMVEVKNAETMMLANIKKGKQKGTDLSCMKKSYEIVKNISPLLQQSLKVLNSSFSETLRKRKQDVCTSLGAQFKPFAKSESSADMLFDDDTVKKIKSDLKQLRTTSKTSKKFTSPSYNYSKNYQSSVKTHGSYSQGYRSNYNNNKFNKNRYNNNNRNNYNNFNKPYNKKPQK